MNYKNWMIPIFLIILIGGYYVGKKIENLIPMKKRTSKIIYWIFIYMVASGILLLRSFFICFVLYLILLHLLFDLLIFFSKLLKKKKITELLQKKSIRDIPIILICIAITIYGCYNINHPIIKEYEVKIQKNIQGEFIIGMISDLHLGINHEEELLNKIVEHANSLNADIFVFGGDIFDEYTKEELKEQAFELFGQIQTKYGIYYVEGNHDLITPETKEKWEKNNIQVLSDTTILIENRINLIGRKDARNNSLGNPRTPLEDLIKEAKDDLPIILIDHQPKDQTLAKKLNVDLQLSGHTHAGQIFPANFFLQHGMKENETYHIIVSSGYGVWGYPIRTAGRSEMIQVKISN